MVGNCVRSSMFFFCKSSSVILCLLLVHGNCTEFEVGDDKGWEVPPPKEPHLYNHWAQKNRFILNDTLHFSYKKDSVMVVTDKEYSSCKSARPLFFDKDGDTTFLLDRAGLFYFMSGVAGHCERGQKMVVKVLNVEIPPGDHQQLSPEANPNDHIYNNNNNNNKNKNGATPLVIMGFTGFPGLVLVLFMIVGFVLII